MDDTPLRNRIAARAADVEVARLNRETDEWLRRQGAKPSERRTLYNATERAKAIYRPPQRRGSALGLLLVACFSAGVAALVAAALNAAPWAVLAVGVGVWFYVFFFAAPFMASSNYNQENGE